MGLHDVLSQPGVDGEPPLRSMFIERIFGRQRGQAVKHTAEAVKKHVAPKVVDIYSTAKDCGTDPVKCGKDIYKFSKTMAESTLAMFDKDKECLEKEGAGSGFGYGAAAKCQAAKAEATKEWVEKGGVQNAAKWIFDKSQWAFMNMHKLRFSSIHDMYDWLHNSCDVDPMMGKIKMKLRKATVGPHFKKKVAYLVATGKAKSIEDAAKIIIQKYSKGMMCFGLKKDEGERQQLPSKGFRFNPQKVQWQQKCLSEDQERNQHGICKCDPNSGSFAVEWNGEKLHTWSSDRGNGNQIWVVDSVQSSDAVPGESTPLFRLKAPNSPDKFLWLGAFGADVKEYGRRKGVRDNEFWWYYKPNTMQLVNAEVQKSWKHKKESTRALEADWEKLAPGSTLFSVDHRFQTFQWTIEADVNGQWKPVTSVEDGMRVRLVTSTVCPRGSECVNGLCEVKHGWYSAKDLERTPVVQIAPPTRIEARCWDGKPCPDQIPNCKGGKCVKASEGGHTHNKAACDRKRDYWWEAGGNSKCNMQCPSNQPRRGAENRCECGPGRECPEGYPFCKGGLCTEAGSGGLLMNKAVCERTNGWWWESGGASKCQMGCPRNPHSRNAVGECNCSSQADCPSGYSCKGGSCKQ